MIIADSGADRNQVVSILDRETLGAENARRPDGLPEVRQHLGGELRSLLFTARLAVQVRDGLMTSS